MLVVTSVVHFYLTERNVADGGVKEAVGNIGRFKSLYCDAVFLILGALTIIFGKPILGLFDFTKEGAVAAWHILIVYAATLWMEVYNATMVTGCLRCGGDTRFAMITEVSAIWLIGVPAAFISSLVLGWPIWAAVLAVKLEGVVKGIIQIGRAHV